jgi:hypothetical protein
MDLGNLPELASSFVSLLLLPALGVIGLMHRRAVTVLGWTLLAWFLLGVVALATHHTAPWDTNHFLRVWGLGIALGTVFLLIAVLNRDKRLAPWIRLGLALLTVAVFARSLLEFVRRYG